MTTRIYEVTDKQQNKRRLVEAASAAQAIRHCARETFDATVANTRSVATLMQTGITVERAETESNGTKANEQTN